MIEEEKPSEEQMAEIMASVNKEIGEQAKFLAAGGTIVVALNKMAQDMWRDDDYYAPVFDQAWFDPLLQPHGFDLLPEGRYLHLEATIMEELMLASGCRPCLAFELAHKLQHAVHERDGVGTRH